MQNTYQQQVSGAEWQARCELAALYRLLAFYRMTDLIDTHISLRVPDEPNHFLINHYGVTFDQMKASDLVKIDGDGRIVSDLDQHKQVNPAGFVIHSALHAARADLHCVVHTHTADGVAVSAQQAGLLPISQHALKFYGKLSYHPYEGIALATDERARLVADMGQNKAMILANHGLLAAGETVYEAFNQIYFLERACQIQTKALAGGQPLIYPSEAVCQKTAAQHLEGHEAYVKQCWDAAVALLDQTQDYGR
ncbi:MAG: class II aldolase/adducin family protein [Neisseriaceae bacterium]|nr:class II aldolase/adducin family protein [Neisseriaceae bacterium]